MVSTGSRKALSSKESGLLDLLGQIRTCFNRLKLLAGQLHEDLGVNPSMRAVMESLQAEDRQSVPEIARAKSVSRQHIQTIMNALQKAGLVESLDNPAHRRSPLFTLTAKGRTVFREIRRREIVPLRRLAANLSPDSLARAAATLKRLSHDLGEEISKTELA
jgi:DNA-binding MarR family transcriptional regulator